MATNNNDNSFLFAVLFALKEQALTDFSNEQLEEVKKTINTFAVYSAATGLAANIVPSVGGLAAAAAQTGLVWALYVKINKALKIDLSENVMKFVGSALLSNLILNAGTLIIGYAAATVLSIIPIFGQITAALLDGALGFILIYAAAVLYLKLLTKVMKVQGNFEMKESEETKEFVKDVIKDTDLKSLIKEAKDAYKEAKARGEIDKAKNKLECPSCHNSIEPGQKFCTHCGLELK